METVAVIGASVNRSKYGNKCVRAFVSQGWKVYPVNLRETTIEGLKVYQSILDVPQPIERVSIYLHPYVTMGLVDDIAKAKPKDVWLNPGAESNELIKALEKKGLKVVQACSILAIGRSPSEFY